MPSAPKLKFECIPVCMECTIFEIRQKHVRSEPRLAVCRSDLLYGRKRAQLKSNTLVQMLHVSHLY